MSHTIQPAGEAFNRSHYPDDAIFFFDFDGVLADQDEEKLFRLPEHPLERDELEAMADLCGIDHRLYPNTGYLRHLIFQSQSFDTIPKAHHEATAFTFWLEQRRDPFFIVTARSGLWAVDRMMGFVHHHGLTPQEVFCLGRSSKADLLAKLRQDWPERPFVFFEDSMHHIDDCKTLADPLLEIVQIEWPACTKQAEAMRLETLGY